MQKNILIALVGIVVVGLGIAYFANSGATQTPPVATEEYGVMASSSDEAMMDDSHVLGVVMKSGALMTVWMGDELTMLDHDIALKNGTKVSKGGTITGADGKVIVLKDGQELTAEGKIMTVDVSKMTVMETKKGDTAMKGDSTMKAGTFEPYAPEKIAKANAGPVVLFFHASWCPTCRALTADIKAHLNDIPEHVTILDVDYDSSQALKQKYGVTIQHTLVQVDASGNLIKTWQGSPTLADLLTQVKK